MLTKALTVRNDPAVDFKIAVSLGTQVLMRRFGTGSISCVHLRALRVTSLHTPSLVLRGQEDVIKLG